MSRFIENINRSNVKLLNVMAITNRTSPSGTLLFTGPAPIPLNAIAALSRLSLPCQGHRRIPPSEELLLKSVLEVVGWMVMVSTVIILCQARVQYNAHKLFGVTGSDQNGSVERNESRSVIIPVLTHQTDQNQLFEIPHTSAIKFS